MGKINFDEENRKSRISRLSQFLNQGTRHLSLWRSNIGDCVRESVRLTAPIPCHKVGFRVLGPRVPSVRAVNKGDTPLS